MATTRRNATTTLTAGGTYNIAQPRSAVRLSRHLTVTGAVKNMPHTVSGGSLVPNPPAVAVRQAPVVGSIIRLTSARSSYISQVDLGLALQHRDPNCRDGSYSLPRYYGNTSEFYVVVAVSSDSKYMRVIPLWSARGYSTTWTKIEGVWTPTVTSRFTYNNEGQIQDYPTRPLTASEVLEGGYAHMCAIGYKGDMLECRLAKATSVVEMLSPEDFSPTIWDAAKLYERKQASVNMYARLAQMATMNLPESTVRRSNDDVRRHYRKSSMDGRQRGAEMIRTYLSRARALWTSDRAEAQSQLANVVNELASYCTDYEGEFSKVLAKWSVKCGFGVLNRAHSCGHYHEGESVSLRRNAYGDRGTYCPTCAESAVLVTEGDEEVLCHRSVTSFMWDDGVRRFQREPGIIGGRHSGKGVVGYVEPLVKQERAAILTLGLELEMQAYNGNTAEGMAKAMRVQFESANLLGKKASRKYLHFEEDGSTGPGGFEMVTGYTDIKTHDKLLKALLCRENGKPAWNGKLRSHDASGKSCGIHVHIQAPKSLIHASKIRYFINAADSEQLVRDVARRYNESFAKIERSSGTTLPTTAAATMLKGSKGYGGKADKATAKMAMQRINRDRYQAINFQNVATVEFRIFRGSMLHETVMACLEFTQAVYEFCRFAPATGLTVPNFLTFVSKVEHRASTRNLRTYLSRKGHDVVVPTARKVAAVGPTTTAAPELCGPVAPALWTNYIHGPSMAEVAVSIAADPVLAQFVTLSGLSQDHHATVEDDYEVTA